MIQHVEDYQQGNNGVEEDLHYDGVSPLGGFILGLSQ